MSFGGNAPPYVATTEDWNGVSWVETTDLSTARGYLAGAGSSTSALGFGGLAPSASTATEEWSGSSNTIKVLTD